MNNIISDLKVKKAFSSATPVSDDAIKKAEEELSLHFSPEYREYLKNYGVASFYGHELTGLSNSNRLNVINVTKEEKSLNDKIL